MCCPPAIRLIPACSRCAHRKKFQIRHPLRALSPSPPRQYQTCMHAQPIFSEPYIVSHIIKTAFIYSPPPPNLLLIYAPQTAPITSVTSLLPTSSHRHCPDHMHTQLFFFIPYTRVSHYCSHTNLEPTVYPTASDASTTSRTKQVSHCAHQDPLISYKTFHNTSPMTSFSYTHFFPRRCPDLVLSNGQIMVPELELTSEIDRWPLFPAVPSLTQLSDCKIRYSSTCSIPLPAFFYCTSKLRIAHIMLVITSYLVVSVLYTSSISLFLFSILSNYMCDEALQARSHRLSLRIAITIQENAQPQLTATFSFFAGLPTKSRSRVKMLHFSLAVSPSILDKAAYTLHAEDIISVL